MRTRESSAWRSRAPTPAALVLTFLLLITSSWPHAADGARTTPRKLADDLCTENIFFSLSVQFSSTTRSHFIFPDSERVGCWLQCTSLQPH